MLSQKPKEPVYLIIPVHNRKTLTLGCLENLTKTGDRQKYHIVVIDDGSTDGTTEDINAQYPDVIVLPGDGDLWWTGAIAKGMEYAYQEGAEYLIWLNDDSLPEVNTLPFLIEFARKNPDTIVSPACYNLDEKKIEDNGFQGRITCSANPGEKIFVEGMCGWCTVIPKSVFSKIGPPNAKRFPQYSGDDTYTLKATRSGFKACILGDVKVNLVGPVRQVHKVTSYLKPGVGIIAGFKSLFGSKKSPYYLPSRFFYHTEKYGNVLGFLLFLMKMVRWLIELIWNFLRESILLNLERLTVRAFSLVKGNKSLRNFIFPLWKFSRSFGVWTQSFNPNYKKAYPPESFNESTQDWIVEFQKKESEFQGSYIQVYPSDIISRQLPQTLEEKVHWKFREESQGQTPETFVAIIPQGRVWKEGNVITPDHQLLTDVSKIISRSRYIKDPKSHPILSNKKLSPAYQIEGTVAVLSAPSGRGYFHWMSEVLPRLELLRQAGINFEKVDKFLVNSYVSRFHVETLTHFGIAKAKILETDWYSHIQAERLIVPSLVGETGYLPKWGCDFLRKEFLPQGSTTKLSEQPERIYINRSQVTHRKVTNETDVISLLEQKGFHNIALESLSVKEQAWLLSQAKVIVSAHGAGLTNLVFCNPGTKVIEMFSPNSVPIMFWGIANQVNLEYYYLIGEGERPPEYEYPYNNTQDITINLDSLSEILNLAKID